MCSKCCQRCSVRVDITGIAVDFGKKKAPFQGKKSTFLAIKAPISQTKSTFGAEKKHLVNIILLTKKQQ